MAENNDFATGYAVGRDATPMYGGGFGGGLFGGWGGNDLIALVVILALFGGGWGGFGGYGGGHGGLATQADLSAGFANSEIMSDLNDIILQNSQNTASIQQTLCQGFSGVNQSLERGFYGISGQIASCCCDTQRAIDSINYNMAKNTCDILRGQADSTRQILDYLTGEKICALQSENSTLKGQISQTAQTATLLNAINRTPSPAYVVPNPYCCQPYSYAGFGCCATAQ